MRILLIAIAIGVLISPASAVDTDGDGLLDLMDVEGFDPNKTGTATYVNDGIQDLDGVNQLTNVQRIRLWTNQITSIETGDFDGLTNLQWLSLHKNQITSIESGAFEGLTSLQRVGSRKSADV